MQTQRSSSPIFAGLTKSICHSLFKLSRTGDLVRAPRHHKICALGRARVLHVWRVRSTQPPPCSVSRMPVAVRNEVSPPGVASLRYSVQVQMHKLKLYRLGSGRGEPVQHLSRELRLVRCLAAVLALQLGLHCARILSTEPSTSCH